MWGPDSPPQSSTCRLSMESGGFRKMNSGKSLSLWRQTFLPFHAGVRVSHSVIFCKVLAQAADPESCIGGFDLQNKLGGGQLVVEVERCRSVRRSNQSIVYPVRL